MKLPEYPGSSQCVRLGSNGAGSRSVDPSAMRMNYGLAERTGGLLEQDVDSDPLKQFDKWVLEHQHFLLLDTILVCPARQQKPHQDMKAGCKQLCLKSCAWHR